jgi:hypothetical protein
VQNCKPVTASCPYKQYYNTIVSYCWIQWDEHRKEEEPSPESQKILKGKRELDRKSQSYKPIMLNTLPNKGRKGEAIKDSRTGLISTVKETKEITTLIIDFFSGLTKKGKSYNNERSVKGREGEESRR